MAVDPERSGGNIKSPYTAEVEARNYEIARRISNKEVNIFSREIVELDKKYPGLINLDAAEAAWAIKSREVIENVVVERNAGLMNDQMSRAPGIFVTGQMDFRLIEPLQIHMQKEQVDGNFNYAFDGAQDLMAKFELYLPKGLFQYNDLLPMGVQQDQEYLGIFSNGKLPETEIDGCKGTQMPYILGAYLPDDPSFGSRPAFIGRIEGAGGTLWQNPLRNPDGSLKTVELVTS